MRTGDEDECLRDDSDLQVDDSVQLSIVVVASGSVSTTRERDTEFAPEEVSLEADSNESNPVNQTNQKTVDNIDATKNLRGERQIETVSESICENCEW